MSCVNSWLKHANETSPARSNRKVDIFHPPLNHGYHADFVEGALSHTLSLYTSGIRGIAIPIICLVPAGRSYQKLDSK